MKNILFSIRCTGPSGGAIKMRDYYNHTQHSDAFTPNIYIPENNIWGEANPWEDLKYSTEGVSAAREAQALFISGFGWDRFIPREYYSNSPKPIIYLVQGLFKLNPEHTIYSHFSKRAIRICVSPEIERRLKSLKIANGPIFSIPGGIDNERFSHLPDNSTIGKDIDVLILGLKNHELAYKLYDEIPGQLKKSLLIHQIPQTEYLSLIQRSRIVICLPCQEEGLYLPALEAMRLGCLVVCPDVGGNRHFCIDRKTSLLPDYNLSSILASMSHALRMSKLERYLLLKNASKVYNTYSINNERSAFLDILHNIDHIW